MGGANAVKGEVLQLYRALLRAAKAMPTKHRRQHIEKKVRQEFAAQRHETDPEKIRFAMTYGELQLETVRIQAASLTKLKNDPLYQHRDEI